MLSAHETAHFLSRLNGLFGPAWHGRGWSIAIGSKGPHIAGDWSQFYLDAMANDAEAALAAEFLRCAAPDRFEELCEEADLDGIDYAENLPVFLHHQSLAERLAAFA